MSHGCGLVAGAAAVVALAVAVVVALAAVADVAQGSGGFVLYSVVVAQGVVARR